MDQRQLCHDRGFGRVGQDRHPRAERGDDARRASGAGVAGNGHHVPIGSGEGGGRVGEGVGVGIGAWRGAGRQVRRAASLAQADDPRRRLGGQDRVCPDRSLAGEHDRVGPVEDCVGHVARLGARRPGRRDHRLQHLGRHDRRDAAIQCAPHELFLEDRDLLVGQLDPEVAARHHDRVGNVADGIERVYRRPGLDLGDDGRPGRAEQAAQLRDIGGSPNEGLRQVVRAELDRMARIGSVLLGEPGDGKPRGGDVDAGVRADQAASHDLRLDLVGDGDHAKLDRAIGEQDSIARSEVDGEARLADVGAGARSGHVTAWSEPEGCAGLERHLVVHELAQPDFRPGQVGKERNRAPGALGGGLDRSRRASPGIRRPV